MRTLEAIEKLQAERKRAAAKLKKQPHNRGYQVAVSDLDKQIAEAMRAAGWVNA